MTKEILQECIKLDKELSESKAKQVWAKSHQDLIDCMLKDKLKQLTQKEYIQFSIKVGYIYSEDIKRKK